jgi:hypothetical protein
MDPEKQFPESQQSVLPCTLQFYAQSLANNVASLRQPNSDSAPAS